MGVFCEGVLIQGKTRYKIQDVCFICHENINLHSFTVFGSCGHMLCTSCYLEMIMKNSHETENCPMCRKFILFRIDECTHQLINNCEYVRDIHTMHCSVEHSFFQLISTFENRWSISHDYFPLHNLFSLLIMEYIQNNQIDIVFSMNFSKNIATYALRRLSSMIRELDLTGFRNSPEVFSAVETSWKWMMTRISNKIKKIHRLVHMILTFLLPNVLLHRHLLYDIVMNWTHEQMCSSYLSGYHITLDSCLLNCLLPVFREKYDINIDVYLRFVDLYRSVFVMNSYNTTWIDSEIFDHMRLSNKQELLRVTRHMFAFCNPTLLQIISQDVQSLMLLPEIFQKMLDTGKKKQLQGSLDIQSHLDLISASVQIGVLIGRVNHDLLVTQLLYFNVIHQRTETIHLHRILHKISHGLLETSTFFNVVNEWK